MQTIQRAVKGKIHQHHSGDLLILFKIDGHHVIFIKPGDPQFLFNSLCIPVKGFPISSAALDQKGTDGLQDLSGGNHLIAGFHDLQKPS